MLQTPYGTVLSKMSTGYASTVFHFGMEGGEQRRRQQMLVRQPNIVPSVRLNMSLLHKNVRRALLD